MNIQLLLQMLMGQERRVPMDRQMPMGRQDFSQIDPQLALPLFMETYPGQPKYIPYRRMNELVDLYYTQPRRGVMPRRTGTGVEEGYRQSDHDWMFNSGMKF